MNREIKFRAWSPSLGEFLSSSDGEPIINIRDGVVTVITQEEYWKEEGGEPVEAIDTKYYHDALLMQYTGLKDKNGEEIYEGDVVRFDNTLMECLWLDGECRFTLHQRPWNEFHDVSIECEVIGNIYENPELLKS